MNGSEFKAIRESLGIDQKQLATYLGYSDKRARLRIDEIETGRTPVPRYLDKLMTAYAEGYRPASGGLVT